MTRRQNRRAEFANSYRKLLGENNGLERWAYKVNRQVDKRKREQFRRKEAKGE